MYTPAEYSNFKYLIYASDNFLCLSNSSSISGSSGDIDYVNCIYRYFNPSDLIIPGRFYSYDSISFNDISSTFTDNIYDVPNWSILFISAFCLLVIYTFVINQLSKLVYKGGLFRF